MLLHVLAHIDAHHGPLVVEQEFSDRAGQLGLAHSGRTEEQERTNGPVRVAQSGAAATNRVGHGGDRLVLADHPTMQKILEVDQFGHLTFHQTGHGHSGGLAHDLGDVLGVDLFFQHAIAGLKFVEVGGGLRDAALQFGNASVSNLGRHVEIGLALHHHAELLHLFLQVANGRDGFLLLLPVFAHVGALDLQHGQFVLERRETLHRCRVGFLLERDLLDLQLQHATLDDVDLGGKRVDLDAQFAGGLVDQIDGLVRKEATGDVAIGEHRGAHQCRVLDAHTMMHFVALLQPAQNRDGVLDGGLAHVHLLETTLERRVLLHVLSILVERGGADHAQLTTGQHGLDHVPGVHGALGPARTNDGVQFVDERDHLAGGIGDLLQHGLQTLLELAAILRARQQAGDVERDEPLVLQSLGNVAIGDTTGQALDDGRLAHAGLSDEHRVVLGAATEHLNDPADLGVASDHRIDLAVTSALGEVLSVLLESLELFLGVLIGDAMTSAHVAQCLQQLLAAHPETLVHRQQQVLDAEEVVLQVFLVSLGHLKDVVEFAIHARLVAAVGLGQLGHPFVGLIANHQRCQSQLGEDRGRDGVFLAHEGRHHVIAGEFGVRQLLGLIDRGRHGLLRLVGPVLRIERHVTDLRRNVLGFRTPRSTNAPRRR